MELRRTVQRVDGVGVVRLSRITGPASVSGVVRDTLTRSEEVVADEPDRLGHRTRTEVSRGDSDATVGESARDLRAAADSDLTDGGVAGEDGGDTGPSRGSHGEKLMSRPHKSIRMLVDIVPVGEVPAKVKREASSALRTIYNCEVTVHDEQRVPEGAYDRSRDQYRAEQFIELVSRVGGGEKNIGITSEDLYYRRRNYVFGLAYLNGDGSVISTNRLRTTSDGGFSAKSDESVFTGRVRKEIVHEIGHTLGLEHCEDNRCVMSFSPTVREVDRKEEEFCGTCSREVW